MSHEPKHARSLRPKLMKAAQSIVDGKAACSNFDLLVKHFRPGVYEFFRSEGFQDADAEY